MFPREKQEKRVVHWGTAERTLWGWGHGGKSAVGRLEPRKLWGCRFIQVLKFTIQINLPTLPPIQHL